MNNPQREGLYRQMISQLQHLATLFPEIQSDVQVVVPQIENLFGEPPALGCIDPARQRREITVQQQLLTIAEKLPRGDDQVTNFNQSIAGMMEQVMM